MPIENVPGNEANSDSHEKNNRWDGFWFVHGIMVVSVYLVV